MGEREERGRLFRDRDRVRRSSCIGRRPTSWSPRDAALAHPTPSPVGVLGPSRLPRKTCRSTRRMLCGPSAEQRSCHPPSRAPAPTCARILARASNASSHHHPAHAPSSVHTLQATHHVLVSPRGNRPRAQRPRTAPHFIPADRAAGRRRERDVRKRNEPPGPASPPSGIAASSSVGGARARLTDRPVALAVAE